MKKRYKKDNVTVIVTTPSKFFGRWRFVLKFPKEKDIRNAAAVYCGSDGRLKYRWDKNPGVGLMPWFIWAADKARNDIAGRAKVCGS